MRQFMSDVIRETRDRDGRNGLFLSHDPDGTKEKSLIPKERERERERKKERKKERKIMEEKKNPTFILRCISPSLSLSLSPSNSPLLSFSFLNLLSRECVCNCK